MERQTLELRREAGGLRYYLDGRGIHAGDLLERRRDNGAWEAVRFEWNYRADDPPQLWFAEDDAYDLTEGTRLRWIRKSWEK